MKKTLLILSTVAIVFAACNYPKPAVTATTPVTDTLGLAQFQAWKAQNELKTISSYNPYAATAQSAAPVQIIRYVPVRSTSRSNSSTRSYSMNSASSNTARAVRKRGWSKAAKATAIGAGGGAVLGAIINKRNPLVGGVIGGVLGGAVGYGIGHSMDKKDGRY